MVLIYMPAMPHAVASMLACARIGAVHWYVNIPTIVLLQDIQFMGGRLQQGHYRSQETNILL